MMNHDDITGRVISLERKQITPVKITEQKLSTIYSPATTVYLWNTLLIYNGAIKNW